MSFRFIGAQFFISSQVYLNQSQFSVSREAAASSTEVFCSCGHLDVFITSNMLSSVTETENLTLLLASLPLLVSKGLQDYYFIFRTSSNVLNMKHFLLSFISDELVS